MNAARAIADAVVYEGYILWPYRRSAIKNQQRWTFGGVYPRAYSEGQAADDPWLTQTQCLLVGGREAAVDVTVRFLQVVERRLARRQDGQTEFVDQLTVDGERYLSWDEAVERQLEVRGLRPAAERREAIDISAASQEEALGADAAIVRSWEQLRGTADLRLEPLGNRLLRATVHVANETPWEGGDRALAQRRTFCSTHVILYAADAHFVSLTDPPVELHEAAAACENIGTWPVLVGEQGARDTVLSSPVILPDYPEIAPESPGDLFDATEIDQLLVLNVLSLTPEEQEEMRASDPRAREILDRCASLSSEELMRLHGAIREFSARGPQ